MKPLHDRALDLAQRLNTTLEDWLARLPNRPDWQDQVAEIEAELLAAVAEASTLLTARLPSVVNASVTKAVGATHALWRAVGPLTDEINHCDERGGIGYLERELRRRQMFASVTGVGVAVDDKGYIAIAARFRFGETTIDVEHHIRPPLQFEANVYLDNLVDEAAARIAAARIAAANAEAAARLAEVTDAAVDVPPTSEERALLDMQAQEDERVLGALPVTAEET